MTKIPVKIVLTHVDAKAPVYAKDGDAGADVRVMPNTEWQKDKQNQFAVLMREGFYSEIPELEEGDYILAPGEIRMMDLGFRIEIAPGYEMQVRSRSGLSKDGIVVINSPGTIDAGYRGKCMVLLHNVNPFPFRIKKNERVAQFVLKHSPQAEYIRVDELSDSDRGKDGFGSTGVG